MRTGRLGSLAVVMLSVAACGDPNSTTSAPESTVATSMPSTTSIAPAASGRLRITQHQTGCCYTEGQVSFLVVSGPETVKRQFQAMNPITPVVDIELEPGSYEIESYQQPCDGNCGMLDPPTNQCNLLVDIADGDSFFFTIEFAPGADCTITLTDTPLQSPVPDDFALREPYDDCGLDFSLASPGGAAGIERSCLMEANSAGRTAELSAYETGPIPDTPDFLVYRTNADRSVDVFLPNLDRETDGPWRRYSCAGLEPDDPRGFVTVGCTDPVDIGPSPGPFVELDTAGLDERQGCAMGRFYAVSADGSTLVTIDLPTHYERAMQAGGTLDETFDLPLMDVLVNVEVGPNARGLICTDVGSLPQVDRTYRAISGTVHVSMSLSPNPANPDDPYWLGTGSVTINDVSLIAADGSEMHITELSIDNAELGTQQG